MTASSFKQKFSLPKAEHLHIHKCLIIEMATLNNRVEIAHPEVNELKTEDKFPLDPGTKKKPWCH